MGQFSYLIANANLRFNPRLTKEGNYNIYLNKLGIENETNIPDAILVKYALEEYPIFHDHSCALCKRIDSKYAVKRRIKIVSIWEMKGLHQIRHETIDERQVVADIIKNIRETFLHGKYLCTKCDPPFYSRPFLVVEKNQSAVAEVHKEREHNR